LDDIYAWRSEASFTPKPLANASLPSWARLSQGSGKQGIEAAKR
jgi:hypothetical protein